MSLTGITIRDGCLTNSSLIDLEMYFAQISKGTTVHGVQHVGTAFGMKTTVKKDTIFVSLLDFFLNRNDKFPINPIDSN